MTQARPLFRLGAVAQRLRGSRRGNVAVEFALIVPILLVGLTAVVDLGRALYFRTEVASAVRTGQSYALTKPNDTAGAKTVTEGASSLPLVVPTPTLSCECQSTGAAIACGATPICSDSKPKRQYMTISAQYTFTPIFSTYGIIDNPITALSVFRVK